MAGKTHIGAIYMSDIPLQQRWNQEERIIFHAIQDWIQKNYFSPSLNDLVAVTGFSNSKCFRTKERLIEKGFLKKMSNNKYQITLDGMEEFTSQVLVIGRISTDFIVLLDQTNLSPLRIPYIAHQRHFALQMEEDTMLSVGILPKDYLIFQEDAKATENDIVLIQQNQDNPFLCMKYVLREGQAWLQSFVSSEKDLALSEKIEIKGVFCALYRDWKGDLFRHSLDRAKKETAKEAAKATEAAKEKVPFALSDSLWEAVKPLIPQKEKEKENRPPTRGHPPLNPRKIVEGFFYLLKSQCTWSELPKTYNKNTFFGKWKVWRKDGFFDRLWEKDWSSYSEMEGITWEYQSTGNEDEKKPVTRPFDAVMQAAGKLQRKS